MTETVRPPEIVELTADECLALLRTRPVGRLVWVEYGRPHVRPLTYAVHRRAVIVRLGDGDLLRAIDDRRIAFEVDHLDEPTNTGWSVIVHGTGEEIWRTEELQLAREALPRSWAPGERDRFVRLVTTRMTGRRVL